MMIIMILSYDASLYGLVFLSLSDFSALWRNISQGFKGRGPQALTGVLPLDPAGGDPQTPCHCPSRTKILDPFLGHWAK